MSGSADVSSAQAEECSKWDRRCIAHKSVRLERVKKVATGEDKRDRRRQLIIPGEVMRDSYESKDEAGNVIHVKPLEDSKTVHEAWWQNARHLWQMEASTAVPRF